MANSRLNILYVYKILHDYSDENNIITMPEVLNKIKINYGISLDRRTVLNSIKDLIDFGIEISTYSDNRKGYYLMTRLLEDSEIRLLSDAIFSLSYISKRQSKDLIEKIEKIQSIYKRKISKYIRSIEDSGNKINNAQVFLNVEIISEAIENNFLVEFNYFEYGLNKKLHPRRNHTYIMKPHEMVANNRKYYLVASSRDYDDIFVFRLDYIMDLKVIEEIANKKTPKDYEKLFEKSTYAFVGKDERIVLRCDKVILNYVIEEFGTDISIKEENEKYFIADFNASSKGVVFWALQFLPYVEVIKPQSLRYEIIESIKNNLYKL